MISEKVVLITGAGSGLGRATALQAAELGATVVANDLGTSPEGEGSDKGPVEELVDEIESNGGEAMLSFGDVTDLDYVERAIKETVETYGRLDGIVNYAGFLRDAMSFNMTREQWDGVIDVHLTGHFNLIHTAGKQWRSRHKEQADGLESQRSFVSVSSASARGSVGQANYSAAKAGILGLTRTAARDLHRYNVRVNAMMPAALTPLVKHGVPDEKLEQIDESEAGPDRVAPLPIALLSDEATDLTGWTFAIGVDTVYTVTDPEFERKAIMKGGWTPDELADTLDDLLDERPRTKTSPGGLLGRVL